MRASQTAEYRSRLTSPAFVVAISLLLLNDWLLKPMFGGWLTGKLSDVAGLFAFPLFFTALLPRERNVHYALTAVGFVLWKSPAASAPLAFWNSLGMLPIARVVDYTDWLALLALVPSYRVARQPVLRQPIGAARLGRRLAAIGIGVLAFLAFTATSVAPPHYPIDDPNEYVIPVSKDEAAGGLFTLGLYVVNLSEARRGTRRAFAADTFLVYMRHPPERELGLTVELSELSASQTRVRALDARSFGPKPTQTLHRAFQQQVFEPLRDWAERHRKAIEPT